MPELRYHPQVKKDLKRIEAQLLNKIRDEYLPVIKENPTRGNALRGYLHGIRSYHFKFQKVQYRIAYVYSEKDQIITVLMIGKRENFYTVLSKRVS